MCANIIKVQSIILSQNNVLQINQNIFFYLNQHVIQYTDMKNKFIIRAIKIQDKKELCPKRNLVLSEKIHP